MKYFFLSFWIIFHGQVLAQSLSEIYQSGLAAQSNEDWDSFKKYSLLALQIHPSHPSLLAQAAHAFSINHQSDSSCHYIRLLTTWNADTQLDSLAAWKNLSSSCQNELRSSLPQWKKKTCLATHWSPDETQTFHPEHVYKMGNQIWMTDVHKGYIYQSSIVPGPFRPVLKLNSSAMAIEGHIDSRHLWASTAMIPQYHEYDSLLDNHSHLHLIQLEPPTVLKSVLIPGEAVIGDMVRVDSILYLSNSIEPIIYQLDLVTYTLDTFTTLPDAYSLQGITYDSNQRVWYIADYIRGIAKVDQKGYYKWLNSDQYLLKGIDGLRAIPEGLLAIQNNSTPKRLILIKSQGDQIAQVKLLDNQFDKLVEPTNGFYDKADQTFWYIPNSPWPAYGSLSQPIYEKWRPVQLRYISFP